MWGFSSSFAVSFDIIIMYTKITKSNSWQTMVEVYTICNAFLLLACILISSKFTSAQNFSRSTAYVPTSWTNKFSGVELSMNRNTVSPILMRESPEQQFACGFYCPSAVTSCLFGVLIFKYMVSPGNVIGILNQAPQLVWAANRDKPVRQNATLELRQNGGLTLVDSDGVMVWSSNTGVKRVSGLNLTESGNLVLFGKNKETIWQSFDYPTDTLLIGQRLVPGQSLTASVSVSNLSRGSFVLSIGTGGLAAGLSAYVISNPPQQYFYYWNTSFVQYDNGSFYGWPIPYALGPQFMRFGSDGHLKLHEWSNWQWKESRDILSVYGGDCGYPLVCGNYGVCSKGLCSCPDITDSQSNFFRPNDFRQPSLGCSLITPISCSDFRDHSLIELKDMYYFAFNSNLYSQRTELNTCKTKCLSDCSCRAALFLYHGYTTKGGCLVLKEIFSIADNQFGRVSMDNTSLFIKVQKPARGPLKPAAFGIVSAVGALVGMLIVVVYCFSFVRKRFFGDEHSEDEFLDIEPGMPFRYSYDELKAATSDFSAKLGEGGFGSVYEGTLTDGTKIAVKCIDGFGHAKDSFLVEVKIIGSIHHVNLVRLIGFCTKMSERFLVYEYMDNGSLEKWIFSDLLSLQWHIRQKIMVDIAKGLAYLHEQCSHKILHLDIKPQNILLDKNFNAKLSDFGLSKLIEKHQSRTVTRMRGTPGYMAPEWLGSVITEKVDVFSFGVVMLEIVCGRKNLDLYRVEEEQHLLSLFTQKVKEEDGLWEIVDKRCEDIELHKEEAIKMMKIAAWCLQNDLSRRPSMSRVTKVFDGLLPVETNLDYEFNRLPAFRTAEMADEEDFGVASPLLPSVLSGPR